MLKLRRYIYQNLFDSLYVFLRPISLSMPFFYILNRSFLGDLRFFLLWYYVKWLIWFILRQWLLSHFQKSILKIMSYFFPTSLWYSVSFGFIIGNKFRLVTSVLSVSSPIWSFPPAPSLQRKKKKKWGILILLAIGAKHIYDQIYSLPFPESSFSNCKLVIIFRKLIFSLI